MGRAKRYSRPQKGVRRANLGQKIASKQEESDDSGMEDIEENPMQASGLQVARKKQIFKKSMASKREIQKRILELKLQSKKLRKRNLDQKSQKKQIAA